MLGAHIYAIVDPVHIDFDPVGIPCGDTVVVALGRRSHAMHIAGDAFGQNIVVVAVFEAQLFQTVPLGNRVRMARILRVGRVADIVFVYVDLEAYLVVAAGGNRVAGLSTHRNIYLVALLTVGPEPCGHFNVERLVIVHSLPVAGIKLEVQSQQQLRIKYRRPVLCCSHTNRAQRNNNTNQNRPVKSFRTHFITLGIPDCHFSNRCFEQRRA